MSDKKPERHGTEDYWMSDKLSREANDTNWLWRTVRKYDHLDLRKYEKRNDQRVASR